MAQVHHRTIATNGIDMHIAEAGSGPLVVLCHGFPESWYPWRHQLSAVADAGYHVVAPDQRGYGQTDAPAEVDVYTQFHLVGDIVGLVEALDERQAVIVGHDWGAPVAWNAALWRPDVFRAVVGLSVPFSNRAPAAPTDVRRFRQRARSWSGRNHAAAAEDRVFSRSAGRCSDIARAVHQRRSGSDSYEPRLRGADA